MTEKRGGKEVPVSVIQDTQQYETRLLQVSLLVISLLTGSAGGMGGTVCRASILQSLPSPLCRVVVAQSNGHTEEVQLCFAECGLARSRSWYVQLLGRSINQTPHST